MVTVLLAAALSASPTTPACQTPQPGPSWVCHDGGWLPPGHPDIPKAVDPPPPPPPAGAVVIHFRVGAKYRRDATGAELYISGIGTASNGIAVLPAECLKESRQDGCLFVGQGLFILAHATTSGWTEIP